MLLLGADMSEELTVLDRQLLEQARALRRSIPAVREDGSPDQRANNALIQA
jgi:hypothetical protein